MDASSNLRRTMMVVKEEWGSLTLYSAENDVPVATFVRPPHLSIFSLGKTKSVAKSESGIDVAEQDTTLAFEDEDKLASDIYRLSEFTATQFAIVLEDATLQLRVLVSCNAELHVSKTLADMGTLVACKFGVLPSRETDELARVDPRRLHCEQYKVDKLDADRNFLGEMLERVYKNMTCKKSYRTLVERNEYMGSLNDYRVYLVESDSKNKANRHELAKRLRQQRNHIKSVTYDADAAIEGLKTKIEDVAVNAAVRRRYTRRWQLGRAEQHRQALAAAERAGAAVIERYKLDVDHEHRVHSEIELFTNIAIDATLREVEVWMEKYDRDIEAIDLQIQKKKADYYYTCDKTLKLKETLTQHAALMTAWLSFKEDRHGARVYAHTMMEAALVVQAWWRGIIVRRELGPFHPKPKEKDAV